MKGTNLTVIAPAKGVLAILPLRSSPLVARSFDARRWGGYHAMALPMLFWNWERM